MTIRIFSIIILAPLFLASCKGNSKKDTEENSSTKLIQIDASAEVQKWKNELLNSKKIGEPCNFDSVTNPDAGEWKKMNEGQYDGLPKNDADIKAVSADLDNDGKQDLLMYFIAENCSGHNGGAPSFVKIVYANGSADVDLMKNLKQAVVDEYNHKREKDKTLKEITDNYLDETLFITYNNGLVGECDLYAQNDPHCCPSYNGTFSFNIKEKKIDLVIKQRENRN